MQKVAVSVPDTVTEEIDGLRSLHHELEAQIAALERHLSLTPAEQVERVRLKKEKLRVKDRLAVLVTGTGDATVTAHAND